ncbi:MAG TPA: hypothetical protein VIU93_12340 [Gallionellaceae bacterium]
MGPMFSALLIAAVLLALLALVFIVARIFQPTTVAFRTAAFFVSGVVAGIGLFVVAYALIFGGGALASTAQIVGYLTALTCCGLLGGALVLWARNVGQD